MPKIPTFQTEGRITAEVGGVKSNVQVPLSQTLGTALAPATQAIVQHRVQEKNFENKTEALKLENEALLQFTDTLDRASRLDNKDQAFELIKTESERIKNNFSNKASNKYVQTMFNNNFYGEVQKGIFKVNSAVSTNIIQSLDNEVGIKKNRLLTQAYLDKDPLAFKLIGSELKKLYEDNFKGRIDVDEYNRLIQNIPSELQVFEVNQKITENPLQALKDLRNKDMFKDISLDKRIQLERDALSALAPEVKSDIKNYFASLEYGKPFPIDEDKIKEVLGNDAYQEFKETQSGLVKISGLKNSIYNSKIGEEQSIFDSFEPQQETFAQDIELKKDLAFAIQNKREILKNDPANLFLQFDETVRNNFSKYDLETNEETKSKLFNIYIESMEQAQINMGIPSDQIKLLPNSQAKGIVADYNRRSAQEKIGYLQSLEQQYGDNYGRVLMQLSENDLPTTAKLISYFNDEQFAVEATSVDTQEERKILDEFVSTRSDITKQQIKQDVASKLEDFRAVVFTSNPYNTSQANSELDNITDTLTYIAINRISSGTEVSKAVEEATNYINNNFYLQDTYFIPRNYTSEKLIDNTLKTGHMEFIAKKAEVIKKNYLDQFDVTSYKSVSEDVPEEELNLAMNYQMKNNGVWVNSADGSGIVFAIQFSDGTFGLVQNKKGELLKINFDDFSYKLPTTDIIMDFEPPKSLEEQSGGA
jgi:hypothetical protein